MRLKSVLARNMPEAMRRVREQFGEHAMIVQTQTSDDGVLITVAVDREPAETAPPDPDQLRRPADVIEVVADAMDRHAVPSHLADALTAAAEQVDFEDAAAVLAAVLGERFRFAPLRVSSAKAALVLVGPVGSGKTVTVARLAAEAVLSGHQVTLATADTSRAGAVEQLGAFARALGLELHRAETAQALPRAGRNGGLLLVDAPGSNPFSSPDLLEMREFASGCGAEPVLVLPAGLDPAEAAEVATLYADQGIRRMLVTRLDATRRLGTLLAAADRSGLAFAGFTASRQIGDPVIPGNPEWLADRLINQTTTYSWSADPQWKQRAHR